LTPLNSFEINGDESESIFFDLLSGKVPEPPYDYVLNISVSKNNKGGVVVEERYRYINRKVGFKKEKIEVESANIYRYRVDEEKLNISLHNSLGNEKDVATVGLGLMFYCIKELLDLFR